MCGGTAAVPRVKLVLQSWHCCFVAQRQSARDFNYNRDKKLSSFVISHLVGDRHLGFVSGIGYVFCDQTQNK